jgi:hypothetical protein
MSLDVSLESPPFKVDTTCPHCSQTWRKTEVEEYWSGNITHNLGLMAEEAGIYEVLWRPEEVGITTASQMIEPLTEGLKLLSSDPDRFKVYDAPNGWGRYEHLWDFVEQYLRKCKEYPSALVRTWR